MPAAPGTKPLKPLKPGMGLYQVFNLSSKAPDKSKPWAVVNLQTGDVNGRWHATREEALAQARAMYATLGDKAKVHGEDGTITAAYFFSADPAALLDGTDTKGGVKWVEAIAAKTYATPGYGDVEIAPEKIDNFITNLNNNVRGQEIAIDYEHGLDPAKGHKAAGWIRGARKNRDGKLELALEFTEPAKQEIINKEWKYFSLEWDDEWMHPDGVIYQDVVMGGALTNRPVAKGLMPINFSEIFIETSDSDYEFAVWSTAYMNSLPDSSFAWIDSDGNRHLPYKDKSGKIDLAHVRAMIQRAPQVKGIPDAVVARVQAMGKRLLAAKGMSELLEVDTEFGAPLDINGESKELEHSDPGTGIPPAPRTDGDGSDDADRRGGWRREPPPAAYDPENNAVTTTTVDNGGGNGAQVVLPAPTTTNGGDNGSSHITVTTPPKGGKMPTFEIPEKDAHELLRALDLPVDADGVKVVETVKLKFGELAELQSREAAQDQEKLFAEKYPQYWSEHRKLMERDRDNSAHAFSESVSRIRKAEGYGLKETKQGLSPQAKEKVAEVHKKFSEGTASIDDFEECIKEIVNGGIVAFGELGSTGDDDTLPEIDTSTANGVAQSRKLFAEVVQKIQNEHEDWDYMKCVDEGRKKHPDLYDAYQVALPA
jgi:Mu-like prophage I protein